MLRVNRSEGKTGAKHHSNRGEAKQEGSKPGQEAQRRTRRETST